MPGRSSNVHVVAPGCTSTATSLCLFDRFAVSVEWRNGAGTTLLRFGRIGTGPAGWPFSSMFCQPELEATIEDRVDELASVESLFVDTLADAARSASGHARDTLRDLAEHSRASGTAVGGRVQAAVAQLAGAVAGVAQQGVEAGTRTLRNEAELLAGLAAGVLRGIADRLHAPAGGGAAGRDEDAGSPDRPA